MTNKQLIGFSFALFVYFLITLTPQAYAEEFDFQVKPIFPETQIGDAGYYHLQGNPNESITLQAEISNQSESEQTVVINSMNAFSGSQGILYQEKPVLTGSAILEEGYQFKSAVSHPEEVTLAPSESTVVDVAVTVPNLSGTLLGSLSFQVFKGTDSLTTETENSQLLIDEYRAINLGVQIDVTEYADTPDLAFSTPHFSPEQIALMVPMANNHPVIVENISGTYEITKTGEPDFSLTGEIPLFKMAPVTTFDYPINWANEPLTTGTYLLSSTFDVNGIAQTFEDEFVIEDSELEDTQKAKEERGEVEVEKESFPWLIAVIGLLLALIVALLIIIAVKFRKLKTKE